MQDNTSQPTGNDLRLAWWWGIWSVTAAFGTYFCMYGLRKPFTVATFSDGGTVAGLDFKSAAVSAQVIGYMLAKFIGIKVVSEMKATRRAVGILILVAAGELALVLFGALPRPWNIACLFGNGLSLGMVFGLVVGFLEGRRVTEALTAGLCASFILADGVTKSVGSWLLELGVAEDWMPSVAGAIFLAPLCIGVAMLARIPAPNSRDVDARAARTVIDRAGRKLFFRKHGFGLFLLVAIYLLITVLRSVRADFAPELWSGLGHVTVPSTFTRSELWVALGILAANGCVVFLRDNRLAFLVALATCGAGLVLIVIALLAQQFHLLAGFPFMVLVGLGLYLPYVAMHTAVFERLLAMTRDRANLGFLLYVADAFGYLGYVLVMIVRNIVTTSDDFLGFFVGLSWAVAGLSLVSLLFTWRYFWQSRPVPSAVSIETEGTSS